MEDTLRTKVGVDQVLMISIDANSSTPEHRAIAFKNLESGEEPFLNGRVLELGSGHLQL
jgi:hypothetical protein